MVDSSFDDRQRERLHELFVRAVELDESERAAFCARECDDDAALRQKLEAMLAELPGDDESFLAKPVLSATGVRDLAGKRAQLPVDEWEVPETIGPYRILGQIGEGGMGVVLLGEQTEPLRRRVAIKVIKVGMDTKQVLNRFERERQALALMDHSCIARVLDAGATDDGHPYFAMEYIDGEPITRFCDTHQLSIAERIALFQKVCAGVQHAHQKGVIHRDLKPSNVLVTMQDDQPMPKIIDFGVARAIDQHASEATLFTEVGQIIGTLEYMSPEQARIDATDVDTTSDVYSLGVLLYELLSGALPVQGAALRQAGLHEIHRRINEVEPPKPSTRVTELGTPAEAATARRHASIAGLCRELRGDLDWIVLKAIEKERGRRYVSPAQLAEDLQRHLVHEPVIAGPPSASYRLRKLVRRYRAQVTAAAFVLVALIVGLVAAVAMWNAEQAARVIADGRRLSALAMVELSKDQPLAARLAIEGAKRAPGPEALSTLYRALDQYHETPFLEGHDAAVGRIAVSHDGRWAVSTDLNDVAILWDLDAGELVQRHEPYDFDSGANITFAGFTPDARAAVTTTYDAAADGNRGVVAVFAVADPSEVAVAEVGSGVRCAAISNDGRLVYVGCEDGVVRRLDLQDLGGLEQSVEPVAHHTHEAHVLGLAVSHDGRWLASLDEYEIRVSRIDPGSTEQASRIIEIERQPMEPGGHGPVDSHATVQRIGFSHTNTAVIALDAYGILASYELESDRRRIFQTPRRATTAFAMSPDGTRMIQIQWVLSFGRRATLWNLEIEEEDGTVIQGPAEQRSAPTFSADNRSALILMKLGTALATVLIDADTGQRKREFHGYAPTCGVFERQGERCLVGHRDGSIRKWGGGSFPVIGGIPPAFPVGLPAVSADGRRAFGWVWGDSGVPDRLALYDTETGARLWLGRGGFAVRISPEARFDPSGRRALVVERPAGVAPNDYAASLVLLDTDGNELRREEGDYYLVQFNSDGSRLLSSDGQGTLSILEWPTLAVERKLGLSGGSGNNLGGVTRWGKVESSPDGRRLLVRRDQTAIVDVVDSQSGEILATFRDHTVWTSDARFTRDGRLLATVAADGRVFVYDADTFERRYVFDRLARTDQRLSVSESGRYLAAWSPFSVYLFDLERGERVWSFEDPEARQPTYSVEFCPGETELMVAMKPFIRLVPIDLLRFAEGHVARQFTEAELERYGLSSGGSSAVAGDRDAPDSVAPRAEPDAPPKYAPK